MKITRTALLIVLALGACGPQEPAQPAAERSGDAPARSGWDLRSSTEGASLVIDGPSGATALLLYCPAGEAKLVVNVPAFRPIGSEERLSFGQGGEVVALVADPSGDERLGGVTAEGEVPGNLVALLSGRVSVSYGAQVSGPHPAPPPDLVNGFAAACLAAGSGNGALPTREATPPAIPPSAHPCLVQDGKAVPANSIRAIGTEPFWGASVQGRCVTYSHPEDQAGTRVWTKFTGTAENGTWTGALGGRPFVMKTRPQPGCSDGMSDNRYPIGVALTVGGEQRSGCALPR